MGTYLAFCLFFVAGFIIGTCVGISGFQSSFKQSFIRQLEKDYVITRRKQWVD